MGDMAVASFEEMICPRLGGICVFFAGAFGSHGTIPRMTGDDSATRLGLGQTGRRPYGRASVRKA